MGSNFRVSKLSDYGNEVMYKWVRDDDSFGYVTVDRGAEMIRPCDQNGQILGEMRIRLHVGDVENPDFAQEGRFVSVAAAIFKEWKKKGFLPDEISRNFG